MSASFRALTLLFCLSLFFSQGKAIKSCDFIDGFKYTTFDRFIIGFAIRCYVCNSMNDPNCATLSSNSPSYSSNNYLRDCNDLVGGYRYSICRKIDQSVTDPFGIIRFIYKTTCLWTLFKIIMDNYR